MTQEAQRIGRKHETTLLIEPVDEAPEPGPKVGRKQAPFGDHLRHIQKNYPGQWVRAVRTYSKTGAAALCGVARKMDSRGTLNQNGYAGTWEFRSNRVEGGMSDLYVRYTPGK